MPGDRSGVRGAETSAIVLVVDDDAALRRVVVRELEHWGHTCVSVDSAEAAIASVGGAAFTLLVTDLHLPMISGVDLIVELRKRYPLLPAILMSGNLTPEARTRAQLLGGVELVDKPFCMNELRDVVARLGRVDDPELTG